MDNLYSGGVVWMRDPTPWQLGISFYSHKLAEWVYIGTFNFKTLENAVSARYGLCASWLQLYHSELLQ